jgi:hypothetical protein
MCLDSSVSAHRCFTSKDFFSHSVVLLPVRGWPGSDVFSAHWQCRALGVRIGRAAAGAARQRGTHRPDRVRYSREYSHEELTLHIYLRTVVLSPEAWAYAKDWCEGEVHETGNVITRSFDLCPVIPSSVFYMDTKLSLDKQVRLSAFML